MIEDMDSNEIELCPIKIALEISVPSSLASQLNWAVESDSVSKAVAFLNVSREGSCGMSLANQSSIS
jgi:hypothetical protein